MALLIECPNCKNRNSLKNISCNCGKTLRKASGKVYWIEYYLAGSRKRERIGSSKQAAENRLREVQTAKAEGRYIRKNKNSEITLGELSEWYLGLSEVKEKRSFKDIEICLKNIISRVGDKLSPSQLTMERVEQFRQRRLTEKTQTGRPAKPSTVNRDVANFKAMLNRAIEYSLIEANPIEKIRQLEENNVRERILTEEEFQKLLKNCSEAIKGQVLIAYYLPMRRAEILNLRWEEIDFKVGLIRLGVERTKNKKTRAIPLHPSIARYLRSLPRPINGGFIFENRLWRRKSYAKAVKEAGLGDFTFHDLRHCAINNLRLAGNDQYLIKQASGHKTDVAFRRYNLVTEDEMRSMKWYNSEENDSVTMDTYMDTSTSNTKG